MELKLYKLITSELVSKLRWVNNEQFCVWVPYVFVDDFVNELKKIIGDVFCTGEVNATMLSYEIVIDLENIVGDDVDLKEMFPLN